MRSIQGMPCAARVMAVDFESAEFRSTKSQTLPTLMSPMFDVIWIVSSLPSPVDAVDKAQKAFRRNTVQKQGLIYKCTIGHISFAKHLQLCGMKGCAEPIEPVSERDIEWFYKISPDGLAMNEKDLHMMMEDKNMPKEVKKAMGEIFPERKLRKKRFWFA